MRGDGSPLRGGTIDSQGDHRLAMLGAVAGLASQEGVEVLGMDAAACRTRASSGTSPLRPERAVERSSLSR